MVQEILTDLMPPHGPPTQERFRRQMRKEELPGKMIADLLIADLRYGAEDLRKIALDRIRADRGIISDEGFRKEMELQKAPLSLMMDIIKDL